MQGRFCHGIGLTNTTKQLCLYLWEEKSKYFLYTAEKCLEVQGTPHPPKLYCVPLAPSVRAASLSLALRGRGRGPARGWRQWGGMTPPVPSRPVLCRPSATGLIQERIGTRAGTRCGVSGPVFIFQSERSILLAAMASVPSAGCLLAKNQYYRSKCSGTGSPIRLRVCCIMRRLESFSGE